MKSYKILLTIAIVHTLLFGNELIPTKDEVAKLYVATFNRAPDSAGLNYWTNDSKLQLSKIAESFFDQSETKLLYPEGTTSKDFVKSVYANLFNRVPDNDGWDYWIEQLDNQVFSKNRFIEAVINGAKDDDGVILANKTEVGISFANGGLNDTNEAKSIMASISSERVTVTSALSHIDTISTISIDPSTCTQMDIGNITTDTTWSDKCYTVTKDIRVYDGALLTINAGTTIFFKDGIALRVDSALKAVGTATQKILFTGVQKSVGYWDGLYITHANDNRNEISYSTIEYAGGGHYDGALYIDGDSSVNIHDTIIKNSKTYGFNIKEDVTIRNFKNVTATSNDKAGLIYAKNLSKIDNSSNFLGNTNDYLYVYGENITTDQTWTPLTVTVYFFKSDIRVYDGALLTISPNSTFLCSSGFQLRVDSAIKSIGTATQPIIFKGKQSTSGYWDGLLLEMANDNRNELSYTSILDAGGGYYAGGIYLAGNSQLTVNNSTISNSKTNGIYISRDATLHESSNTFSNNTQEDVYQEP